jgi:signal transduction histidine kinase
MDIMKNGNLYMETEILKTIHTIEIEDMKREFAERNKALTQTVNCFSHDLSAPLKSILGLINVARMDKNAFPENELLNLIECRVQKLESYITDVTNMSRNSTLDIVKGKVYLKEVIDEILGNLDYCENFNRIDFIRRFSDNTIIETDPIRLKIILSNLITNAVKFHVLDGLEKPIVDISFEEKGNENRLTVSDNGRGIKKQNLDKIFDMFYRATTSCEGSGLGLYITKETVKMLSGSIHVESKIYEGTQFIVILPKHAA